MLPLPAGRSMTAISMYQTLLRGDPRGCLAQRLQTSRPKVPYGSIRPGTAIHWCALNDRFLQQNSHNPGLAVGKCMNATPLLGHILVLIDNPQIYFVRI